MKVLFNLQTLHSPRTGIGYYTQHIIEGMLKSPEIETVVGVLGNKIYRDQALTEILNETPSPVTSRYLAPFKKVLQSLPGTYALRNALHNATAQKMARQYSTQEFVYHETGFIAAPFSDKTIITVHDLSHIRHPGFHPAKRVAFLNHYLPQSLQKAKKIITVSQFTADELQDCYQVDPNKIVAIPSGVETCFQPFDKTATQEVMQAHHLQHGHYILSVCTFEPRKNLVRLIEAFLKLPSDLRESYPLVLIGGLGWQNHDLMKILAPLVAENQVRILGYLSRKTLLHIYAGATAFVYPSLYEGFGLPILEAMASGTPVIAADIPALQETAQKAALFVNPYSPEQIAAGLKKVLTDSTLAQDLKACGLMRAQAMSWENCYQKTQAVYQDVSR